jgi:hypothetical protein
VTYVVNGSPADVTYGPAGSDLSGSVPMRVTQPLSTPDYYAISAQLQGGGTVSCQILVDGKVTASSTAGGGTTSRTARSARTPSAGTGETPTRGREDGALIGDEAFLIGLFPLSAQRVGPGGDPSVGVLRVGDVCGLCALQEPDVLTAGACRGEERSA